MSRMDCFDPANETPEACLRLALDAIQAVDSAFGAPGNYGYGKPKGDALHYLYQVHNLIVRTNEKATASQATQNAGGSVR